MKTLLDRIVTIALWAVSIYVGVGAVLIASGLIWTWGPMDDVIALGVLWPIVAAYFVWHVAIIVGKAGWTLAAGLI